MPTRHSRGSDDLPALAFRRLAGAVPESLLQTGAGDLSALTPGPEPFIRPEEIAAYSGCDDAGYPYHRMRLRAEAIARLPRDPSPAGTPFLVTVGPEPLWVGVFLRDRATCSSRIPTILIDPERADGLYDWYWIRRCHPDRPQPGPDPRSDPSFAAALRGLGVTEPPDGAAWRRPLGPPLAPADGTSGIRLRLVGADLHDHLRGGGRAAFPSLRAAATPVHDLERVPADVQPLNGYFGCRLTVPPGVYHVALRLDWRTATPPPPVPSTVAVVPPGAWIDVRLGEG